MRQRGFLSTLGITSPQEKQILHNISGLVQGGQLLAILGSSGITLLPRYRSISFNFAFQGSGKTTLLNTLAGKLADEKSFFLWGNTAEVRGKALLNGLSLSGNEIRKFMGYAKNPILAELIDMK